MDLSFLRFLGTIVAIGLAVALPIAFLMRVRASTRLPPGHGTPDGAELESRVREYGAQLDGALRRIEELEERVDFAERLLAQRELPALPREGQETNGEP